MNDRTAAITREEMAARMAAGTAWPLLPGGVPGPMRLPDGRWWAIPADGQDYQLVTGPLAQRLDQHAARLRAAAFAVQRARNPDAGHTQE